MYSRQVEGKVLTFGVSGLLYNKNVLMYDRQTESLWSQVRSEAVTGPMTGAELEVLPSVLTTWKKWRRSHPDTAVLSRETGHDRNYDHDPYESYYESREGFFSFLKPGPGKGEKALVAGIVLDGEARAYPLALLRREKRLRDTLAGTDLELTLDPKTDRLTVRTAGGDEVVPLILYWFVWEGIYPRTDLYGEP